MCHAHMRVKSPDGDDTVIVVATQGTSGTELTETLEQTAEVMS